MGKERNPDKNQHERKTYFEVGKIRKSHRKKKYKYIIPGKKKKDGEERGIFRKMKNIASSREVSHWSSEMTGKQDMNSKTGVSKSLLQGEVRGVVSLRLYYLTSYSLLRAFILLLFTVPYVRRITSCILKKVSSDFQEKIVFSIMKFFVYLIFFISFFFLGS